MNYSRINEKPASKYNFANKITFIGIAGAGGLIILAVIIYLFTNN